MREVLLASACVIALAACGTTHEPEDSSADTSVTMDAGPEDSAEPDTGTPVEPCDSPGAIESASCGMCGSTERFCTSAGIWEYGECVEAPGAQCTPGSTGSVPCGRCGRRAARCTAACTWEPTGECTDEVGECLPGTSERESCSETGVRVRVCGTACSWGAFSSCREAPTDFDGDGSPYGMDCDDDDPSVRIGSIQPCGMFFCEDASAPEGYSHRPGSRRCEGPGWSVCERPAGCPEVSTCPVRSPIPPEESRECPTTALCTSRTFREFRRCFETTWTDWSGCDRLPPPPPDCSVTEVACGGCDEGSQFEFCDGTCNRVRTACLGSGCVPGTTRTSSEDCPDGESRSQTCNVACSLDSPGPCTTIPEADMELLFLVENNRQVTAAVSSAVPMIMSEIVDPFVDTGMRVRFGVAAFTDYPVSPYGDPSDLPFQGVQELTDDTLAFESALSGLTSSSGGDEATSAMEGLWDLTGGTPHPLASPFRCPSGAVPGGCWSPSAGRAIILLTNRPAHNAPHPFAGPGLLEPYTMVPAPDPPVWSAVRDQITGSGIQLFVVAADDFMMGGMYPAVPQYEELMLELYPADPFRYFILIPEVRELDFAVMDLARQLQDHFGI